MVFRRCPARQVTAVILALAEQPATWRYASELSQRLDLDAGSLYPALMRLADRGLLETTWETEVPPGQRPRHRYRLTGPGRALAAELATAGPSAPATEAQAVGGVARRPRRRPRPEGA
jgi:PadR family transcriptional regulator, regulatory protein PadR